MQPAPADTIFATGATKWQAGKSNEGNLDKVMAALRVLRVRGDCGKGMRKGKWVTLHASRFTLLRRISWKEREAWNCERENLGGMAEFGESEHDMFVFRAWNGDHV